MYKVHNHYTHDNLNKPSRFSKKILPINIFFKINLVFNGFRRFTLNSQKTTDTTISTC